MESRELRIGNLISGNYQIVEIDRVGCLVVDANNPEDSASEIYIVFDNINPMLLTEEWLLKFGFEITKSREEINQESGDFEYIKRYKIEHKKSYHSLLCEVYDDGICFFIDGNRNDVFYKSVHQLQNLYFAITGEEI